MFPLRAAPLGALCVLLGASAAAHAAGPSSAVLGAIRELWASSPRVQAAEASLRAAQERVGAAAQPVYNPSLQVDGENADVDRRTVGASLTLDVTGKRTARLDESAAEVRVREAALALERRDIARDWLKAWSGITTAREQSTLGRRRVDLMRRFDALAMQRLNVGDISSPERDLAALALGEAQIQQGMLEAQEADALAALAALAGPDTAIPSSVAAELPPVAAVMPLPITERTEAIQAQAEQDRADASVVVADRNRRSDPTLSLTGGHVRSGTRTDRVIGVSVSLPIPVLNSGRFDVAAARAEADAAFAQRESTQRRMDAQLRQAQATYAALRAASARFRDGRAAAFDERAALLDRLWQAGEISTSDYLMQLKQSLDTALSGIALQNQAWQAWFDYLAAAGRLTGWVDGTYKETSS
jgi:outer membrane protein, heavy metal efflux system